MKKSFFLLICFAASHITLLAQSSEQLRSAEHLRIDSLRKTLPSLKDSARVDCLNTLSEEYSESYVKSRVDSMYYYAFKAYGEAEKIGYKYGVATSLLNLVRSDNYRQKKDSTGKEFLIRAIRLGKEIQNDKVLGEAYYLLASRESETENYKKAIHYFGKAGDMRKETEVTTWLCMSYSDKGEYEEGFKYCQKCIELTKSIGKTEWEHELVQWSLFNMAELYKAAGDYETAMDYLIQGNQYAKAHHLGWEMEIDISEMFCQMGQYDSALFYWHQWEKDWNSYAVGHQALGNTILGLIYLKTKRYDEALKLLEASNAAFRKPGNGNVALLRSLLLTAKVYVEKKNWNTALKYTSEGFSLAIKEKIRPSVMEGHKLLSEIYHALGKDDKAYANLRQYTSLKDSVLNRQFLWRLSSYKKEAEAKKKKAEIELLNKDNQIKDEQLKQENLLKKFLIAGLVGLMLISVFIFRTLSLKQKNESLKRARLEDELKVQLLESQKHEAELRQQASELEMQALRAQMNPHFIFNCLSSINRFILKNESEAASDYLTRFSRLIRLVLSNSKRPLIFLEDELEMLRLYIEMERLRFKNSFDFNITFKNEIEASAIPIPPLLLQPFVENAIWHGLMNKDGHGQLDISFTYDDGMLTCTITDNGVGRRKAEELKSKKDVKGKSMGLQITSERLAKLNKGNNQDTFFKVEDLYDDEGHASGTEVILHIRLEDGMREVLASRDVFA